VLACAITVKASKTKTASANGSQSLFIDFMTSDSPTIWMSILVAVIMNMINGQKPPVIKPAAIALASIGFVHLYANALIRLPASLVVIL